MSELIGWIGRAGETRKMMIVEGILILYDDCCVWSHPDTAMTKERLLAGRSEQLTAAGEERSGLSPPEVLALDKRNWLLEREKIEHAYLDEYRVTGAGTGTVGQYQAKLTFSLIDGSHKTLHCKRSGSEDHSQRDALQNWLGGALSLGEAPPPGGWRGTLVKVARKLG